MHGVDIGLAFLEGLALIGSPCILPALPLVLATSSDGGRRRPYGIITGFVLAFTLFAIVARRLVMLTGIGSDAVRDGSLVLLALFGLVLLSSRLSGRFAAMTAGAADAGNRLATGVGQGFGSGIAIGALIGLVWTPCAGPILAAVLVQVIRQQSNLTGDLVIFAFGLGAGVPMLIIALAGRKIMDSLGFFSRHAEAVRRGFGVLILASVAFLASGLDVQSLVVPAGKPQPPAAIPASAVPLRLQHGLAIPYQAPKFAGITAWLNSPPLTMKQLHGKVVLIDFWTYSCINCIRTLPYLTAWYKKYRDKGLVIVGVHSPEFEFEKNIANVRAAVRRYGIRYPVALDNNLATWLNFDNEYWPAHYLIDRQGRVVYTHFGEGDYAITEDNIRFLLGLKGGVVAPMRAETTYTPGQTPETYLGYARAERYAGDGMVRRDTTARYRFPARLSRNDWALSGTWTIESQKIVAGRGAALRLHFYARKVFLVLGTTGGQAVDARLMLDGKAVGGHGGRDAPAGVVHVDGNRLYELIDQKTAKDGLLQIDAAPGLEAYAFTFG